MSITKELLEKFHHDFFWGRGIKKLLLSEKSGEEL